MRRIFAGLVCSQLAIVGWAFYATEIADAQRPYLRETTAERVARKYIRREYDQGSRQLHEYTVDCRTRYSRTWVGCESYWKYYNRGPRMDEYCKGELVVIRVRELRRPGWARFEIDDRTACYQIRPGSIAAIPRTVGRK